MAKSGIMIFLLKNALSKSRIERRTPLIDNAHTKITVSHIAVAISRLFSASIMFIFYLATASQRFALPACGWAWILFGSRKSPKPEKCLKMPQNPTRQVHAVLCRFYFARLSRLIDSTIYETTSSQT